MWTRRESHAAIGRNRLCEDMWNAWHWISSTDAWWRNRKVGASTSGLGALRIITRHLRPCSATLTPYKINNSRLSGNTVCVLVLVLVLILILRLTDFPHLCSEHFDIFITISVATSSKGCQPDSESVSSWAFVYEDDACNEYAEYYCWNVNFADVDVIATWVDVILHLRPRFHVRSYTLNIHLCLWVRERKGERDRKKEGWKRDDTP